jgi:hypothetical protein
MINSCAVAGDRNVGNPGIETRSTTALVYLLTGMGASVDMIVPETGWD